MTKEEYLERKFHALELLVNTALHRIEALEAKPEQMQPVVLPQDAALDPDEPGVLPAGNPEGDHWTEGFEGFLREQLELAEKAHRENPSGPMSVRPRALKMVMDAFLFHKRQGAA